MAQVGRRIYYDLLNGAVLQITDERQGDDVTADTVDDDFQRYVHLSERTRESVGIIELEFGQYRDEFFNNSGFSVDVATQEIKFNMTTPQDLPDQKSLYERVQGLDETMRAQAEAINFLLGV